MAIHLVPPGAGPANPRPVPAIVRQPQRLLSLATLLERFERDDMENAVDLLLAMMDAHDGDPDIEPNGDERDISHYAHTAAGRPRDIAITEDDEIGESETDVAWRENINQTAPQFRHVHVNELTGEAIGTSEDTEDDDDDSGIEDVPHDPLSPRAGDLELDEGEYGCVPTYGVDQSGHRMGELAASDTLFAANAS